MPGTTAMSRHPQPLLPLMQQLHATMGCPFSSGYNRQPCEYCSSPMQQCSGLCHLQQSSHLLPPNSGTFSTQHSHNSPNNNNTNMTDTSPPIMTDAAPPPIDSPPTPAAAFLANLPIRSDGGGLSSFDHDTLERYLTPVMEALQAMDAETILDLKQTKKKGGAKLRNGVFCKPIHNEINPPKSKHYQSCVRYLHLSEVEEKYSIGIFVFPPYATIPLHDHPGMCVLSRVLYGDLHRLSLDLCKNQPKSSWFSRRPQGSRRALKNGVDYLQAPDTTVLYPYEGNLHEFVAGPQGAAVLDVLLPPYNDGERDCTFYNIEPSTTKECWIIPTNQPEDFHCLPGSYGTIGQDDDSDEEEDAV